MKKILVIREFENFSRILLENGLKVVNLPLIKTRSLEDLSDFEEKLSSIENYDGIFLTSRNSAQLFADKLQEKNITFKGKVYILGKRGFEILKDKNLELVFFADANTADEMLEKISTDELKNKHFLFIRGEKSLRTIPKFLINLATFDETIVYQTENVSLEIDKIYEINQLFEKSEVEVVCFFSPSGAESFLEQFEKRILENSKIAVIGKTTAQFFEAQNLRVDFIAEKATSEDFAVELSDYLRKEI